VTVTTTANEDNTDTTIQLPVLVASYYSALATSTKVQEKDRSKRQMLLRVTRQQGGDKTPEVDRQGNQAVMALFWQRCGDRDE
jgi:uncharacterized protein (DUF2267 family)